MGIAVISRYSAATCWGVGEKCFCSAGAAFLPMVVSRMTVG
jgi:hypothetical protein